MREAAQFYVREVLFFAQADAYRVLGVDADASDASIKAHHRLLQHWLHPDRLDNEDDAIFASRVNVAWNRLRNQARRRAYDEDRRRSRWSRSMPRPCGSPACALDPGRRRRRAGAIACRCWRWVPPAWCWSG
ncbi:DnaJ domain-containing protein [Thermomonas sp.]|uniref:J domain-containing protein n=1 Tax=Thermomonas sp. TaxID=1971895 RepID=UPI00262CDBED|nr:DnaJ domain-containing protein [Thermomonas sp.]MBL0229036.1 DnaJ domain-containing protein [Thermomonas sp.]